MVFRFCPQCGKAPLAHNAMREGEYSCPDCKGEFYIELLSEMPLSDEVDVASLDAAMAELSPSEELQVATAELEEVADFEMSAEAGLLAPRPWWTSLPARCPRLKRRARYYRYRPSGHVSPRLVRRTDPAALIAMELDVDKARSFKQAVSIAFELATFAVRLRSSERRLRHG